MSEIAFNGGTERALLHGMRKNYRQWLAAIALVLAGASVVAATPATNAPAPPQPARWLLVVDTSAAMEKRAQAMEGVIGELLLSGINGQMQPGDQLGVWTYNKELFAGIAPMQTWDPGRSNIIAGRSSRFVGRQKFQDRARLEVVIPELNRVAKESRQLTVLLFSDGSQKITGTPFDEAINEACAQRQPDLAQTRMPLVTVLRAERGHYIGQTVSFAPWPIEFPPFSPEPDSKPAAPSKPVEPMKSIIIGGAAKPAAPATNVLPETTSVVRTNVLTIAPVEPLTVVPVQPTPTVEPAPPAPAPKPEAGAPASPPIELAQTPPPPATPAPHETLVAPPTPPPAPIAAAPAAVVEPVKTSALGPRKWLLILGIGCMWVAIVLALIWVRRSRRAQSASLITRSFDRNQH